MLINKILSKPKKKTNKINKWLDIIKTDYLCQYLCIMHFMPYNSTNLKLRT